MQNGSWGGKSNYIPERELVLQQESNAVHQLNNISSVGFQLQSTCAGEDPGVPQLLLFKEQNFVQIHDTLFRYGHVLCR